SAFGLELANVVPTPKGPLGFRPATVTDRVVDGQPSFEMKVDVVERLGSDQFLYGMGGGDQVTARVAPRMTVGPGDRVKLGLDTRSLHFFDAESEQALL